MKSASFIDFSSWIIQNADRNLHGYDTIFEELTSQFWSATKVRQQRWNNTLIELEPHLEQAKPNDDCWGRLLGVSDEILLSETLSRIWFAVIITKTCDDDIIDIAQCIIPDHVKVRKRVLGMWELAPHSAVEFFQRTQMVRSLRDQATDLMLSQISEEVVGRNLSISFATFDQFYACSREYEPEVLMKANRVLSKSYAADIAKLSPFECVNVDLNLKTLASICNSFDDEELELPEIVTEAAAI